MNFFQLILFVLIFSSCTKNKDTANNQIALSLKGYQFTISEFAEELANKLKPYDSLSAKSIAIINRAKQEVAEEFIIRSIHKSWAKENNIIISKENIDSELESIRKSYPDDLSLRKILSEQNMTIERWKINISNNLLKKKIVETLSSGKTSLKEEELKAYYDSNKEEFTKEQSADIQQIVVAQKPNAELLLSKLKKKGVKFEDLAKEYSTSPEGKEGGHIKGIEKGVLSVFDRAMELPINRVKLLESSYGYHIIRVKKKTKAKTLSFKEVKDSLLTKLTEQKKAMIYNKWLKAQFSETKIQDNKELIEGLSIETKSN